MRLILRNLIFIGASLCGLMAKAQITGLQSYQGPACPDGTVSATTSPEGSVISILFDQFSAATSVEELTQWKWCSLNINVAVPAGYRIGQVQVDERAFADVPEKSWGYLWGGLYVLDSHSNTLMSTARFSSFAPPFQDNALLSFNGTLRSVSNCPARQEQIRLDTGILLSSSDQATEFASATVDSIDVALKKRAASEVHLQLERCLPSRPRWTNWRRQQDY
jgi:hypothetical protein